MQTLATHEIQAIAAKPGAELSELMENIGIGGPTMIRSTAKNYRDVAVVVSPDDYGSILEEMAGSGGAISSDTCRRLTRKAFQTTADYERRSPIPSTGDPPHNSVPS